MGPGIKKDKDVRRQAVRFLDSRVLWADLCFPPQIHMLKSQLPVPQNVIVFGGIVFEEMIELK